MRGCLIGLALLSRFLVLWFVERININLSIEVLRSLSSILWQTPSLVPAYHSHSWGLSSLEQYFTLGPPTLSSSFSSISTNIHWVFSMLCTWLYQTTCSMLKEQSFHDWFPSDKRSQAYRWNTPHFFSFFWKSYFNWPLGGSNVLEQTFVNDGWFHSHLLFCTPLLKLRVPTVGCGWQWCIKVYFISISSHSSKLDWTDTFFSPPSRFDSTILSHIFGSLKGIGP